MADSRDAAAHIKLGFLQGVGFTIAGILIAGLGVMMTVAAHHPLPLLLGLVGAAATVMALRRNAVKRRMRSLAAGHYANVGGAHTMDLEDQR